MCGLVTFRAVTNNKSAGAERDVVMIVIKRHVVIQARLSLQVKLARDA